MQLKTMRRVDYWIGIPLCFVCTLLLRLMGRADGSERPRRILFIELSEMGSAVIASPALQKARDALDAEIFFLIFERNVDSLRLVPIVPEANILTIRETSLWALVIDSLRFLRRARAAGIDTVVDLELFSRYSALLTALSGARRRVGFHRFRAEGLYRGELLTHRVTYNGHIHMAKNFISMVNALLAPAGEVPYSKTWISDEEIRLPIQPVAEEAKERMRELVWQVYPDYRPDYHRIVLINPNSSELLPQRRWERENFGALATMIVEEWEDVLVLITGSPAERGEARQLERTLGERRIVSFAGMHKLAEITALYHLASVLVTNDSGPAHFSAITPIRSIVLFGPETPRLYGSLGNTESITAELSCSPCVTAANQKNSACTDAVCMRAITPTRVLESVRAALDGESERQLLVQIAEVRRW
ncbi:MAG TPA: glycosyltransferase family 9 protein [Acidobacteriaceae bacterium]|jgi:ADP-heptose:LPS heptosyltransferase|nr:glycosyltransferase family 9 protein [Acidobacteriaceae bacterium]